MAFGYLGINLRFEGKGIDEVGIIESVKWDVLSAKLGKECNLHNTSHLAPNTQVVAVDPRYFRPTEVDLLIGDPSKAEKKLGWRREYKLEELVNDMMKSDLKLMQKDEYLKKGGYTTMNYFE